MVEAIRIGSSALRILKGVSISAKGAARLVKGLSWVLTTAPVAATDTRITPGKIIL